MRPLGNDTIIDIERPKALAIAYERQLVRLAHNKAPQSINLCGSLAMFLVSNDEFDTAVAQRCAQLHVPAPQSERDALIAATALVHGMTVVTRNTADFETTGVALHDPWKVRQGRAVARTQKLIYARRLKISIAGAVRGNIEFI